uniref:Uncharacterized protein n=1 Tax=Leersia perrieri TaxID=77586 RepID=A0A0D9XA07_9ORYZ
MATQQQQIASGWRAPGAGLLGPYPQANTAFAPPQPYDELLVVVAVKTIGRVRKARWEEQHTEETWREFRVPLSLHSIDHGKLGQLMRNPITTPISKLEFKEEKLTQRSCISIRIGAIADRC